MANGKSKTCINCADTKDSHFVLTVLGANFNNPTVTGDATGNSMTWTGNVKKVLNGTDLIIHLKNKGGPKTKTGILGDPPATGAISITLTDGGAPIPVTVDPVNYTNDNG